MRFLFKIIKMNQTVKFNTCVYYKQHRHNRLYHYKYIVEYIIYSVFIVVLDIKYHEWVTKLIDGQVDRSIVATAKQ